MATTGIAHRPELLPTAPMFLLVWDPEGLITLAHGQLLESLGASSDSLIGRSIFEAEKFLPISHHDIKKAFTGPAFTRAYELNGKTFELRVSQQFDSADGLTHIICPGFESSGRQISEVPLRTSETQFQNAFSHATIGFALIGINGQFIRTNPALSRTLGRTAEELQKTTSRDLIHKNDRKSWQNAIAQLLAGDRSDVGRAVRFWPAQGEPRWIQVNLSIVQDAENLPLLYIYPIARYPRAQTSRKIPSAIHQVSQDHTPAGPIDPGGQFS